MSDPITKIFDFIAGHREPNPGRNCARCGKHYVVIGGNYESPYGHYCGSVCSEGDEKDAASSL